MSFHWRVLNAPPVEATKSSNVVLIQPAGLTIGRRSAAASWAGLCFSRAQRNQAIGL